MYKSVHKGQNLYLKSDTRYRLQGDNLIAGISFQPSQPSVCFQGIPLSACG